MAVKVTAELIESNKAKFLELNAKYTLLTQDLLTFLGEGFYAAPASTTLELHNCFPGGLLDHLMHVAKYATHINKMLPGTMQYPLRDILKVSFLCQIGKVFLYELNTIDWQIKKGQLYTFADGVQSMRVGERSAFYALKYGVALTEEEYQAIIGMDKTDEDRQAKWHSSMLTVILRQAVELAINEEKALKAA